MDSPVAIILNPLDLSFLKFMEKVMMKMSFIKKKKKKISAVFTYVMFSFWKPTF